MGGALRNRLGDTQPGRHAPVVEQCGSYEYGQPGQPGFRETNAIVDQGFAGDESMLVKNGPDQRTGRD